MGGLQQRKKEIASWVESVRAGERRACQTGNYPLLILTMFPKA
jgi:hypothetical protein